MNYFTIIKSVLSLLPIVIDAIKAIEAAFPEGTKGHIKLDIVKSTVESAYSVATDVVAPFESIWPVLSGMITAIVTAFNASGLFKTSTK